MAKIIEIDLGTTYKEDNTYAVYELGGEVFNVSIIAIRNTDVTVEGTGKTEHQSPGLP